MVLHRYKPVADGRLRLKWVPAYVGGDGSEGPTTAKHSSLETVTARRILCIVQLHDGVLSHAAARQLDKSGWRLDETDLTHAQDVVKLSEAVAMFPVNPGGEQAGAGESAPEHHEYVFTPEMGHLGVPKSFESAPATRLEDFVASVRARPEEAARWCEGALQQWLMEGYVEFLEVFSGYAELTFQVGKAGMRAGEGLDNAFPAYGRPWPLNDPRTKTCASFESILRCLL